jgi:hypothetical protein
MTMKKFFIAGVVTVALITFGASQAQQTAVPAAAAAAANSPTGILAKFNGLVLSDLQSAEAIAKAANDTIADNCYLALIGLVQQMQTVTQAAGTNANTSVLSNVQVFTAFQKARLIVNAQRSTSPVFQACAPLKAQIKQDALTAPGSLLSLF